MFIIVTISLITILTMNQSVEGRDIFVEASVMRPMFKLLPFEATVLSSASVQCLDHPSQHKYVVYVLHSYLKVCVKL